MMLVPTFDRDPNGFEEADRFDDVEIIEWSQHEAWRLNHKHRKDPGGVILRCPRCFSTKVEIEPPYILCKGGCRYSEMLIDYPVNIDRSTD